jgi:LPS-assembly lipoprotein
MRLSLARQHQPPQFNRPRIVAEYELHEGATFSLIAADGHELVKEQIVSITSTYLNSETEVLGKQQEEGTLRKDMQRDLASQIMRRLEAQL